MNRRSVFMILVSIFILALFPLSAIADKTIFYENFEAGLNNGWTVTDANNDGHTWDTTDASSYNLLRPFVGKTAFVDSNQFA